MTRTAISHRTPPPRHAAPATYAVATAAALLAALLTPAAAHAAPAPKESRPVYSYTRAVRESVWVDTGLDGDGDRRKDRVAADIVRPREPARVGRKVPVIMDASPYTPTLTLDLARTSVHLPLLGGAAAFARATSGGTSTASEATVLDGVRAPHPAQRAPGN
ncbi:hypothetical protein AQJ58_09360 [Streptomyces sp. DSM 15324]|nr:hypothetical protein AQJ58_09360 [Streptomyces sp. DSM 15324]